ncbi:hypothetical protein BDN72DRAFT_180264 [Pluteus cervinus]|uniref:Uncharacterized protein n=1 Tax=Pluteus cervinus TaxID=181527 RepID=A0ACD2ZWU8_9AGAR|nr:hypothetical protein BDN72DRAFT_180264 [Pluteus cervinus]
MDEQPAPPPRLLVNPYHETPPDFSQLNDQFTAETRQALVNAGDTPQAANQKLLASWNAINLGKRNQWDLQVTADEERRVTQLREAHEEQQRREQTRRDELQAELDKKNVKIPSIDFGLSTPSNSHVRPCRYALRQLTDKEYVHLWYFTKAGIKEARRDLLPSADAMDSEVGHVDGKGTVRFVKETSLARPSPNCIPDSQLPWDDVIDASRQLVFYMRESRWPEEHCHAVDTFFDNLGAYRVASYEDNGAEAVSLYQDEVRRDWHWQLKSQAGPVFNLAMINEIRMMKCKNRVREEKGDKAM